MLSKPPYSNFQPTMPISPVILREISPLKVAIKATKSHPPHTTTNNGPNSQTSYNFNLSPPTPPSPAKVVITIMPIALYIGGFYIRNHNPHLYSNYANLNYTHNSDHYHVSTSLAPHTELNQSHKIPCPLTHIPLPISSLNIQYFNNMFISKIP